MSYEEHSDLKELLTATLKLAQENNKMLRKMRRDAALSFWARFLFFGVMLVGTYYVYQHYLLEYLDQVMGMYSQVQQNVDAVKDFSDKIPL